MIIALFLAGAAATLLVLRLVRRPARVTTVLQNLASPFLVAEPPPEPDPFEALRIQVRLHVLADEISQLHHDESIFARAARLEAYAAAYDALLDKACCLAGVPEAAEPEPVATYATPTPVRLAGRDLRARRELLLAERGWSW